MFRSKKDVDKHVADLFSKVKNENERNLRGYSIARQYFQVKDYEMAKRYLSGFLNIREDHPLAHKLMAQIAEIQGNPERSLQFYKRSLELDASQKEIVLKICELYCQLPVDPETARYWADRAEKLFQHHKSVFKLRECIVNAEGEPNQPELEELISSELTCRPSDVTLHTKLLKLYMDTERVEAAFQYSLKMEEKQPFPYSIDWYYCLNDICEAYQEEIGSELTLQFCVHYALILDNLVTLLLLEPHLTQIPFQLESPLHKRGNSVADAAAVLHSLDQFLLKSNQIQIAKEKPWQYIHQHMHGQLYLHLASLLMKRAKKDQGNWKEACRYGGALLLLAYSLKLTNLNQEMWFSKLEFKKQFQLVHKKASVRLSYAGHILTTLCKEDKAKWIQKMKQETCIPQVRDKIFQRAFSMVAPKHTTVQSFFLQSSAFLDSVLDFPSLGSLQEFDKTSFKVYPDSLNHLLWLSLHWKLDIRAKTQPKLQVFEKLQHSSDILNNGAPESLCQLDIEAFLCATVQTAHNALEHRKTLSHRSLGDTTLSVHPDISEPLATEEQSLWWRCAYLLYTNSVKDKLGDYRQILRRGLEVIRGYGNHGLDVNLVVCLARHFGDQSSALRKRLGDDISEELVAVEERTVHYWSVALDLLDKVMSNQRLQMPKERLFGSQWSEPSTQEVVCLREEGRFFLASYKKNHNMLEEAVDEFSKLNSEYASYNLAQVLRTLATKSEDKDSENALLERAKDSLYLTLDRIATNRNHPLNLTLHEEVEAVQMQLAENQDSYNAAESQDIVDVNLSSGFINGSPRKNVLVSNGSSELYSTPLQSPFNARNTSTSNRSGNLNDSSFMHVRPSPERLDAQLRAMNLTQSKFFQDCTEVQKSLLESNKSIQEELKQLSIKFDDIKVQLEERQNAKCETCTKVQTTKSVTDELDEEDEDNVYGDNLYDYALDAENGYGYGSYPHSMVPPHRGATNMGYNYPPQAPMMIYPHQYPPGAHMPQTPMGLDMSQPRARNCYPQYGAGPGLPFSEGQQLPQFSFRMPPPQQGPPQILPVQPIQPAVTVDNRPSVFSRIGGPTTPVHAGNENPHSTLTQQQWENQTPQSLGANTTALNPLFKPTTGQEAANAFQIALPPTASLDVTSLQPPAILSSNSFSQQQTMENGGVLKNLLTSDSVLSSMTPTSFFGSPSKQIGQSKEGRHKDNSYENGSGSESEPEYEVTGDFVAHSPILAEVEVCTGEENEKVLFEERAKLFRFSDKEWKERGVGLIKLLLAESVNKVRLLMRRDQVFKICANHYIKSSMELLPMKENDKAWTWIAEDFADEQVKPEQFCIRFKTVEIAQAFKIAFEKAAKLDEKIDTDREKVLEKVPLTKPSTTSTNIGFGDRFKSAPGTWACEICLITNSANKNECVACETPKKGSEKTEAVSTKPPAIINTKTPNTAGSFSFGSATSNKPIFGSSSVQDSGFGNLFKSKPNSNQKCDNCKSAGSLEKPDCSACLALHSSTVTPTPQFKFGIPQNSSTPSQTVPKSVIGGFTFSSTPIIQSSDKPKEAVPRKVKEPQPPEPKVTSPFSGFQFISPKSRNIDTKASTPAFNFGTPSIATGRSMPTLEALTESANLSSKQPLPSTDTVPINVETLNTSREIPEEFEPSVQFTPVVPLPELVETKTGEEDEETLFVSRAKLFRYDPETKEWKERGLGELKILKNSSGRCRILMRREQVFKLCANHYLLPEMKLTTFNGNDRAWKWFAQDFSEGELKKECLGIKFKTQEIAAKFEKAFTDCCRTSVAQENDSTSSAKCSDLLKHVLSEVQPKTKSTDADKPSTAASSFNFSGLSFQKANEGLWECKECYVRNDPSSTTCISCSSLKPGASSKSSMPTFKKIEQSSSSQEALSTFRFDGLTLNKPKEGSWECSTCYVKNDRDANACMACETQRPKDNWECSACYIMNADNEQQCLSCTAPRPPVKTTASQDDTKETQISKFKFGILDSKDDKTKPVFGQKDSSFGTVKPFSQQSNFSFGSSTTQNPSPVEKGILSTPPKNPGLFSSPFGMQTPFGTPGSTPIEFRFGSPQKFEFNFSGVRPRSPSKGPKSPGTPNDSITEDEGEVSSDADNIFFQPVIPLPPKVDVKTGEEDEETKYSQRAKLYRFDNGEWKERGTGDIKILFNAQDNRIRLLMRREQVLKVCLNHCITKSLELHRKNEKTWLWASTDFSENEPRPEQFAVRFKSKEIAEQFQQAFDDAKKQLNGEVSLNETILDESTDETVEQPTNLTTSKKSSTISITEIPTSSSTSDAAKSFSFRLNQTPGSPAPVKGFGLAAHLGVTPIATAEQFSFRSPAISNNKFVSSDISIVEEKTATSKQQKQAKELQLPSNFYLYEKKEPCSGCRGCESCENDDSADGLEVIFEKVPTEEQLAKAAELLLPSTFYLYEDKEPCPGCRGCDDDSNLETSPIPKSTVAQQIFKSAVFQDPLPSSVFGSNTTSQNLNFSTLAKLSSAVLETSSTPTNPIVQNEPIFGSIGSSGGFSFESLASNTISPDNDGFSSFNTSASHVFAGAGQPLFGAKALNASGGEDEVAPSVDIHFEPVVPLPELIEIKTGEEDEEVVYNERAKLYRYDKTVTQWKERGVGQFKILKNKTKCQYRLILRREQVHKVACNHYLTPLVELSPMLNSESSVCWTAMDFTEGTLLTEMFAIRFKNKDLLDAFKRKFAECRDIVCKNAENESDNTQTEAEISSTEISTTEQNETDQNSEEEEDNADVEEEEDDDDGEIMFEKRVTLAVRENQSQEYRTVGLGPLQIKYDDSIFAAQILMTSDQEELLCNHHIAIQTCLRVQGQDACWTAMDMGVDPPARRHFKAQFSSPNSVKDFEKTFEEGKKLAIASGIVENDDPHV